VVHDAGNAGTDVKPVSPVRSALVRIFDADSCILVTVEGRPVSDVIFGGA
jgi:hypothetical protein